MPSEPTEETVSLKSELLATSRPKKQHPSGWEPGVTWDGSKGILTTAPMESEPHAGIWAELISDWGLNPEDTEVVEGSVQVRVGHP